MNMALEVKMNGYQIVGRVFSNKLSVLVYPRIESAV